MDKIDILMKRLADESTPVVDREALLSNLDEFEVYVITRRAFLSGEWKVEWKGIGETTTEKSG